MIRVCSVYIAGVKFNIELSFCEMIRLYWIKFKNAYTQREKDRKNQKDLDRAHQMEFENSKLMRQIMLEYFW